MYALSKFSFVSNFNKEKFTKQEAMNNGLSSIDIQKCDTDGNGEITVDEILGNSEACDKILAKINAEQANVISSIKSLQSEKAKTETDEKAAEKTDKRPEGFTNFLKQPPKVGESSSFSIAA